MARPKLTEQEKQENKDLLEKGLKKCFSCSKVQKIEEFPVHSKEKGTFRRQCSECYKDLRSAYHLKDPTKRKEIHKRTYFKNRQKIIDRAIKYSKNNKDKVKVWQDKSRQKCKKEFEEFKKTLKCSECGYDKHPSAIDLHHVDPNNKLYLVSKLIYCRSKLKIELEKCIPICANCHRILHSKKEN